MGKYQKFDAKNCSDKLIQTGPKCTKTILNQFGSVFRTSFSIKFLVFSHQSFVPIFIEIENKMCFWWVLSIWPIFGIHEIPSASPVFISKIVFWITVHKYLSPKFSNVLATALNEKYLCGTEYAQIVYIHTNLTDIISDTIVNIYKKIRLVGTHGIE